MEGLSTEIYIYLWSRSYAIINSVNSFQYHSWTFHNIFPLSRTNIQFSASFHSQEQTFSSQHLFTLKNKHSVLSIFPLSRTNIQFSASFHSQEQTFSSQGLSSSWNIFYFLHFYLIFLPDISTFYFYTSRTELNNSKTHYLPIKLFL